MIAMKPRIALGLWCGFAWTVCKGIHIGDLVLCPDGSGSYRVGASHGPDVPGVGQPERATQNLVIALFRDELRYRYLGDWTDRDSNSNIEEGLARCTARIYADCVVPRGVAAAASAPG